MTGETALRPSVNEETTTFGVAGPHPAAARLSLSRFAGEEIAPPDPDAVRSVLRRDFYTFLVRAFAERNGAETFVPGWHIEAMAAKLASVRFGGKRLDRHACRRAHLKSLAASIALPAWLLGHDPRPQIVSATYAQDLSDNFAIDCRALMTSAWYRDVSRRGSHGTAAAGRLVTTRRLSARDLGRRRAHRARRRHHHDRRSAEGRRRDVRDAPHGGQ